MTERADGPQATPSTAVLAPEGQRWDGTILLGERPGEFHVVKNAMLEPLAVPQTQTRELRALIGLRDQARNLLEAEAGEAQDTPVLQQQRQELHAAYDAYVGEYGPLNRYELRRTGRFEKVLDEATGEPIRDEAGELVLGEESMARHRPPVMHTFKTDPHHALVMALENFEDADQSANPATFLTERALAPRPQVQGARARPRRSR
ncbi:hypothetical protein [Ruania zhangjianzhongii]|uniref:hypothetical protein n=1 Tax=Ruania zhangjianzhongii TaxID=2603206 RepID=UPI0011C6F2F5|nr:hypothetical protein [Ruania zhangjianzhongii]